MLSFSRFARTSLLGLAIAAFPVIAQAADFDIDTAHTRVGFGVRHLMVSTVHGTFGKFTGAVVLDDQDVTKSKVNLEIDVASIDTREPKRDDHLRSPDFFDAAKFPKMTFKSTKVEKDGDGLKVTGDLTIKAITKPVVLKVGALSQEVKDPWGGTRRGTTASAKISRKDVGLTWNKALDGGSVVVGDEVAIELEVELVKKAPDAKKG